MTNLKRGAVSAATLVLLVLPAAATAAATPWSAPARFAQGGADRFDTPDPAVAVAADGTSVAGWVSRRDVVMSTGDARGRFTRLRAVGKWSATSVAVAAKPGGRALIAWEAKDGIRVAVRARAGGPFVTRLAAASTGSAINELTAAADPKGGWVLAERRFPRRGSGPRYRVQTVSLRDDGRPEAPAQDLGRGFFGLSSPPAAALRVDADGRAILAFERELTPAEQADGSTVAPVAVATRPHGGSFTARTVPGSTEGRIVGAGVSVRGSDAAISATVTERCGDAGCFGAPGLLRLGVGDTPTAATKPALRYPGRAFAPEVAALPQRRSIVAFRQKTGVDPFSTRAPLRALAFGTDGQPGPVRVLSSRPVSAVRLVAVDRGVAALAVWSGERGFGAAAVSESGTPRFRRSQAPPLPPFTGYGSNLDLAAAGPYALAAAGTPTGVRLTLRRFPVEAR
jgi:hypothetical protein